MEMKNYLSINLINYLKIFIILLILNQLNVSKKVNALKIFEEQKTHSPHKKNYASELEKYEPFLLSQIKWKNIKSFSKEKKINWEKYTQNEFKNLYMYESRNKDYKENYFLGSHNRSIVINNIVGPDISWLVPPGLKWDNSHSFDFSLRGHNRRKKGEPFLGWNNGDAVGSIFYQPINKEKYSLGTNIGIRSVYSGSKNVAGGKSAIGEGLSLGFRYDRKLSDRSGIAFGAEQLIHFDGKTDTGRDLYITATKAWWNSNIDGLFPLNVATMGFGTGKMAEGNIKGLCSDLFGGSGTEEHHQRPLCWAPIFSLAKVWNQQFSTFFEYNSKWFLLGTSYVPSKTIPLRGTFAVQISDHRDNYGLNDFDELKWVFRVSLGF